MSDRPAEPSYAALRRHHERIQAMIDDPQCVGDLLAYGIALARYVDLDPRFHDPGDEPRKTYTDFARESLRRTRVGRGWKVGELLRKDIRRYDPMIERENLHWVCTAPMIRREGPCGKSATRSGMVTDLDTGRKSMVGACSNPRHREWFEGLWRRNREAMEQTPPPVPAANTGGVLARHIPELDWDKIYRELDPTWNPPPEEQPWTRPTFALLLGEAADVDDTGPERPALSVVVGGGELINIDGPRSEW